MISKQFEDTVRKYNLIKKGEGLLVGVSGGPDSLALLYLLFGLKDKLKISLYVAHLDHMIRPDSYKDRIFVENLSRKLKIPFLSRSINVKKVAKKGSLEETARNARFKFLSAAAKQIKAKKIALGHNFDDQAETIIMRILRGTGLHGLSGILPKRNMGGLEIIRPLLEIRRQEIEAFLKKKHIKPRIDKTNSKEIYFRNKIRHALLPLLEEHYNKNIKEILVNMAQTLAYDYDYLNKITARSLKSIKGSATKINLNKLSRRHPAIQRLILRQMICNVKGDTRKISFKHIRELEDLIANRPINSIVDLPKPISAVKQKAHLVFYRKQKPA